MEQLILTWEQFYADAHYLALQLKKQPHVWKGLVAITRGGLIPSGIIAHVLNVRHIDTICISSYDNVERCQTELEVLKGLKNEAEDIAIIDDLVDTGRTFKLVKEMLPNAHCAAIYAKPQGKPLISSYSKDVSQDAWIVFPWEES